LALRLPVLKLLVILCLSGILPLSGCGGNNAELETYRNEMNQFFENVSVFDNAINAIDPQSETAVADLLTLLDSMDDSFAQMAELSVPDAFVGVAELSDEAATYMTEAVSLYHQVLEAEYYNENLAAAAKENYDRANLRLQYILSILHGVIPEDIIVYEDEGTDPQADETGPETDEAAPQTDTPDPEAEN
jgi:hypothetical protein